MFRLWCMIDGNTHNVRHIDFHTIQNTLNEVVKQRNVLRFKRKDIEPPQITPNPCCAIMQTNNSPIFSKKSNLLENY